MLPPADLSSLRPEMRLLLAACSVEEAPAPAEPVDPDLLLRLATFHRVAPLVYEQRSRLPLLEGVFPAFRAAALATLHRNLQLAAELKRALRALEAAGAPVILLKGAHLMDAVYRNPALRPLSDVDLLVRPEGAAAAMEALCVEGYAAPARKAAFSLAADREVRLVKSGVHEVALDLHTDLNRPTRHRWFPMDALWERSIPYLFEGVPARALAPADNLVFLCAHAVPHAFSQLIWLRDIAGLAQQAGEEVWAAVPEIAREARACRATYAGLALACSLLDAPVDRRCLRALLPAPAPLNAWLSVGRIFGGTHYSTLESLKFRAALSDSRRDAASILGAGAARKASELCRGLTRPKQRRPLLRRPV